MSEIISYIYDFLSTVFENKQFQENINEVILFGSVAKKNYDKKSDIDLFFDIKNKEMVKELEESLRNILKSFEIKSEKTWKIKKVNLPINFIIGSLRDENWKGLKDEIISSGIVLYSKYKETPENLKHYYLLYYSLNNLKRKEKMKFIRTAFGYITKKGKIEYKQRGIIEDFGGLKLASNVILISSEELSKIKKLFNEHRIEYKILETWIRK
jgi:predicted nucleotidyltransferase